MKHALIFGAICALVSIPVQLAIQAPPATRFACATAEPGGDVTCWEPRSDGRRTVLAASLPTATHSAEDGATVDPAPPRERKAEPLPEWLPAGVLMHEADIRQAAADTGLDVLALAVLVSIECPSGRPDCKSWAGATGLSQVMPGTAVQIQSDTGYPCVTQATDPLTSLRCGGSYYVDRLRDVSALWQADSESAALGGAGILYNAGPGWAGKVLAHTRAGGYVCDSPVPAESKRWCNMMVDAWERAGRN